MSRSKGRCQFLITFQRVIGIVRGIGNCFFCHRHVLSLPARISSNGWRTNRSNVSRRHFRGRVSEQRLVRVIPRRRFFRSFRPYLNKALHRRPDAGIKKGSSRPRSRRNTADDDDVYRACQASGMERGWISGGWPKEGKTD